MDLNVHFWRSHRRLNGPQCPFLVVPPEIKWDPNVHFYVPPHIKWTSMSISGGSNRILVALNPIRKKRNSRRAGVCAPAGAGGEPASPAANLQSCVALSVYTPQWKAVPFNSVWEALCLPLGAASPSERSPICLCPEKAPKRTEVVMMWTWLPGVVLGGDFNAGEGFPPQKPDLNKTVSSSKGIPQRVMDLELFLRWTLDVGFIWCTSVWTRQSFQWEQLLWNCFVQIGPPKGIKCAISNKSKFSFSSMLIKFLEVVNFMKSSQSDPRIFWLWWCNFDLPILSLLGDPKIDFWFASAVLDLNVLNCAPTA